MRRWITALLALLFIGAIAVYRNELLSFISEAGYGTIYLIALALVLVPVIPYKVVIGTLGMVLGPLTGAFISWLAASTASVLVFVLSRYLFREPARRHLNRFEGMAKLEKAMESRPFLAVLAARLIPLVPQALVNIYPAFTSIRLWPYLIASALGKIPSILLFSYIGKSMFTDLSSFLLFLGAYAAVFLAGYGGYRIWLKDKTA
ncbi:TVP38/TMEM64 family protein [Cohnella sp. AR92]|uniref:TVP38/TMEM64 family protein n=1 Tax=Cohnella sp. AR92 TaxID=648716 RepID=UPI000F8DB2D2|nr:VTT domain-containing protein [Cohnella sp. AR92]RUS47602.1 TVP38/TMEM64 family protein [Cohnella sp. AR92]